MTQLKLQMRKKIFLLFAVSALSTGILRAQHPVSLQFRTGVNVPTSKLGETDLKTGFGFEGLIAYRINTNIGAYAGWGWNRFGSSNSFAGTNADFEETGYTFGLQLIIPVNQRTFDFLLSGGGIYNHIEVENSGGQTIYDSGHGLGWQIESGISVPVANRLRIIPTLRYRSLSRDMMAASQKIELNLNYISAGLALSWAVKK